MELDWGDGSYQHTALRLEPVAKHAVQRAMLERGESVLDLGCGTGNVALAAAQAGAQVTAVDPSSKLLRAVGARARAAALDITTQVGEGGAIPAGESSFDAVIAVFSIIFAPDPPKVAAEVLRVLRPGGRAVIASWVPAGPIHDIGELLSEGQTQPQPPSPWSGREGIRSLFSDSGRQVDITEHNLPFTAESPEALFDELETHHPVWLAVRQLRANDWDDLRSRSIEVLKAGNEDPNAFCGTSPYLLTRVH